MVAVIRGLLIAVVSTAVLACAFLMSGLGASAEDHAQARNKAAESKPAKSVSVELKRTGPAWASEPGEPTEPVFIPVSSGRLLVTVGDTLFMLDSKKNLLWKYHTEGGKEIIDQAVVESTGSVYGSVLGGYMFILDLASGKELYWDSLNGRAAYRDVKAYKNDLCLVVISMWGYRDSLKDPTIRDHLLVWRGKEVVQRLDKALPPDAELQVWGDKILAVTKRKESILVEEVALTTN